MALEKVISGGQTGIDRYALDVAVAFSLPIGGACPKDRLSEDGAIPDRYPLVELSVRAYPPRTRKNIQDSDGTLILFEKFAGGSSLTRSMCLKHEKPYRLVDLKKGDQVDIPGCVAWIKENNIKTLNVAGNRESKLSKDAQFTAYQFLNRVFGEFGTINESYTPT